MENPLLEKMRSGNLNSISELLEEKGGQKICVAHHKINGLEYGGRKSDSFVVDIEGLSTHISDNKNANSRVTLQRSLSRKGLQRGGDKKSNSSIISNNDNSLVSTSPRAALQGASTPEKPMVVTVGPTDHSMIGQPHNSITIMTGGSVGGGGSTNTESKLSGRRFSFRRSSPTWTIDPRRILFIFATLSSMGTILLIYFTLSMTKLNGEDNGLN